MKHKNHLSIRYQYNYYKVTELLKLQLVILFKLLIHKDLDSFFINRIFTSNHLISRIKLRSFCVFTGRSKGLCRVYNVSRIKLRELS